MTDIYLTISLSTHNEDDTNQNSWPMPRLESGTFLSDKYQDFHSYWDSDPFRTYVSN